MRNPSIRSRHGICRLINKTYIGMSNLMMGLLLLSVSSSAYGALVDVADYTAVVTAGALNVRTGPSAASTIVGKKYQNQTVRVTHHDGSWRKIAWAGLTNAYVHGGYLRRSSSTKPTPSSRDVNVSDYDAVVTASKLNIRSGPGTSHSVIGARYLNQTVRVTHHNSVWRRIVWTGGRVAYAHGAYLSKVTTTPSPAGPSSRGDVNVTDYIAYVKASTLSVRSGPASSYKRTNLLSRDQILNVTHHSADGKWAKVQFYNNSSGYVHRDYIYRGASLDVSAVQRLEGQKDGAAEQYLSCMIGKFTSKGSVARKAWTLFRNGVKAGLKKIVTSPFLVVNHTYCLVSAQEWAKPPKPFSNESERCTPTMGGMTGCKELDGFYGTPEGVKIWNAFLFTSACDKECKLTCYFHGKNSRTYQNFISNPRTVELKCRYR